MTKEERSSKSGKERGAFLLRLQVGDLGQHRRARSIDHSRFLCLQHAVHVLELRDEGGGEELAFGKARFKWLGLCGVGGTFNMAASTVLSKSLAASLETFMMLSAPCTMASRR